MGSDSGKVQLADKAGEFITVTNPVPISLQMGTNPVASTIPVPVSLQLGTTPVAGAAPVPISLQLGTTPVASTVPIPISLQLGTNPVAGTTPVPISMQIGNTQISPTNSVPVSLQIGNTQIASTNPVPVSDQGSSNIFYSNGTASSTGYTPAVAFGFTSKSLIIKNDGTQNITFSFDGTNDHGLLATSESVSMDRKQNTQVFFKATTVGSTYRIWAW